MAGAVLLWCDGGRSHSAPAGSLPGIHLVLRRNISHAKMALKQTWINEIVLN